MDELESLNHSKWECKYHVVFIPKCRRKTLYVQLRQVVGFIKGKSAIHLARDYGEHRRNFVGQSFWARGYFVSTVGRDEEVIRNYIRNQEQEDRRLEQMNLWR
jgi:putative transposase